ncbi:MAG: hypothetical protein QOG43_165 [Actinomycetota bacterium]|nr:hypothetical protein [Actinomycetota bacterium]
MVGKGWASASSLVTRRCGDGARLRAAWPWAWVRRPALWVTTWMAMAGGLGRVADGGGAALCLEPPRLRDAPRYALVLALFLAALAAAVVGLYLVWPPLATTPYLVVLLVLGQGLWGMRGHGTVRRRLREARPNGAWLVCNFSGNPQRPGAGRPLLEMVCAEADERRRVLYLDTVVPRLVEYYAELGFKEAVAVPARYAGEDLTVWRMVRTTS